ncbi:hypothetical protein L3Y34_016178 [Caenorhabditis briggsae]|uniref:Protein CBR-CHE-2 n=2 Tax=Caenorhabditis briggsae TaxID=6238 RepID=A0AAE9DWP4_CAEBR|nr:hypothetical protein L3Y34_016178 [Caenorhabditis briggsae]
MKLKLSTSRKARHSEMVCGVGWIGTEAILSAGDDHNFLLTNTQNNDSQQILSMPETFYPTSLHIFPRSQAAKGGQNDVFAVSTSDGKLNILSRSGKMEKVVDAHNGAALCCRWNSDGTGLLSCGEDGFVKMWSRNGMLRSVLAQFATAVYCVAWDSTSSNVLYCNGDQCYIKSLKMQVAPLKWKAHDGIILCCDWSPTAALIVTGAEDLKFKVWDGFGQILFNSSVHDYPITSVAWTSDGSLFAVGSHNILRLCDKSGWSHSLEKMNSGSVMSMSWSPDGTQLAVGTAAGLVFHAHIIDKRLSYDEFEIVQTQKQVIEVRDVSSEVSKETLETKDRISRMSILYKYLIVVTSSHIYIYSSKNWNTPTMIENTERTVNIIVQCEKIFLVSDGLTITTFTYEGRKLINLNPPGQVMALLNERKIDLANDTLVVRDRADNKVLHFFDPTTGKAQGDGNLKHEHDIVELTVNQCGSLNERNVAFRDHIGAVYVAMVKTFGVSQRLVKIGSLVEQLVFNDATNMLCGISEGKIVVWPLPNIAFSDRNLLQKSLIQKTIGIMGKFPQLANFAGNTIVIRKSDGCLVPTGILPFYGTLITMASSSKWDQAIRLCRSIGNDTLWATLASLAVIHKNMASMEIAYAALEDDEKVSMINEIKDKTDKDVRQALQVVLTGKLADADTILERNGQGFRAMMLNIQMFKWKRALVLAGKDKDWIEVVMGYREKYLKNCGQKETDPQFLKMMSEVEIDWVHIRETIAAEKAKGTY